MSKVVSVFAEDKGGIEYISSQIETVSDYPKTLGCLNIDIETS